MTAHRPPTLDRIGPLWRARFRAMASPCEVLLDGGPAATAREVAAAVAAEAWRIEQRYSRYRDDSVVQRINTAQGRPVRVDAEMARLLDFADHCHALSAGAFDISSGILRQAWTFDGGDRVPDRQRIDALLPHIGWRRARWQASVLQLPSDMQIDLGGIGKEYAVDRALALARDRTARAVLVNFGGDLHASGPPRNGAWQVGIEALDADRTIAGAAAQAATGSDGRTATRTVALERGALATSGDARRYVMKHGVRYGHVLDARTGWPATDAPRAVTVAADSCVEAGMLATLAMLQGFEAEAWLAAEAPGWWCDR